MHHFVRITRRRGITSKQSETLSEQITKSLLIGQLHQELIFKRIENIVIRDLNKNSASDEIICSAK